MDDAPHDRPRRDRLITNSRLPRCGRSRRTWALARTEVQRRPSRHPRSLRGPRRLRREHDRIALTRRRRLPAQPRAQGPAAVRRGRAGPPRRRVRARRPAGPTTRSTSCAPSPAANVDLHRLPRRPGARLLLSARRRLRAAVAARGLRARGRRGDARGLRSCRHRRRRAAGGRRRNRRRDRCPEPELVADGSAAARSSSARRPVSGRASASWSISRTRCDGTESATRWRRRCATPPPPPEPPSVALHSVRP